MAAIDTPFTHVNGHELKHLIEQRQHLLIREALPTGEVTHLQESLSTLGLVSQTYASPEALALELAASPPQAADVLVVHSAAATGFTGTELSRLLELGLAAGETVSPRLKSIIVVDDRVLAIPSPGCFTIARINPEPPEEHLHWRSLYETDREFYDLCYREYESMYANPAKDAPPELYAFGSQLFLDSIEDEARSVFAWYDCGYLALALHDLTGLPFALFTESADEYGWSGHAAIALPDGTFLDVEGVVTATEINHRYRESFPGIIEPTFPDRDTFCTLMFQGEEAGAKNPYFHIEPFEVRVLQHCAELVLREAGIAPQLMTKVDSPPKAL